MQIAILETDQPRGSLNEEFGDYGQIFTQWLSTVLPEAEFTSIAVFAGASFPEPDGFNGYLITGSRYGVYEDHPWIKPLEEHICRVRDAAVPMGGICFGHQIMAQAYGGKVVKSDTGWILGRQTYRPQNCSGEAKSVFAIHQDQVVELPDHVARIHAGTQVPYGRLEYAFPALSVQYHPEFYPAVYRKLLQYLRGTVIAPDLIDPALETIKDGTDSVLLAQDFAEFFRREQ